jgi:hypothetical protein
MTDQQLITEYPTVDEPEPEPDTGTDHDLEPHDTVRFDLTDDSSSIDRSREQSVEIQPDGRAYHVAFDDGDHDHSVLLERQPDGWGADCWMLDDDGQRTGRCRGWAFHDGPCAHLWAVRSYMARQRLADEDRRHSTDVERAVADGGQEGRR